MKLIVLGSGGATTIPRPCCQCRICTEARTKEIQYTRSGPSLFISDINLLFDTPEEIAIQLNREKISTVDYIFYTHWHPDHTLGMRITERMNKFWLGAFVKREKPQKKVTIYALNEVINDLKAIKNRSGSYFDFYEKLELVTMASLENGKTTKIGAFEIVPFKVISSYGGASTVYLIKNDEKKVIYAPCDVKPFPSDKRLEAVDLFIIGNFFPEGPLKNGITIPENNELRKELFSFEEILNLIRKIGAKRTLIVHIEEEWGKSFDDYKKLEEKYARYNLQFAYDGMKIQL